MAEIPIQRKHERGLWPWLLALLILALLLWLMFGHRGATRSASVRRDTTVSGGALPSPADTATRPPPR